MAVVFTNQPGTLLGPLTTTFSIPALCSTFFANCPTCTEGFRGQSCVVTSTASNGGQPEDVPACWPPTNGKVAAHQWPFQGWGFYSPGLACPTGYTSACTAVYGRRPDWDIQFTLIPGETAVGCCPSGFTCGNNFGNTCIAIASTTTAVPTALCSGSAILNAAPTHTFPDTITVTATTTAASQVSIATSALIRTMTLYAPMFQLNFQSTDLVQTSQTSQTAQTAQTSQTTSSTAPAAPASSNTGESSHGLSTGALAGICVGVAVVCLALGVALASYIIRRRRKAQEFAYFQSQQQPPPSYAGSPMKYYVEAGDREAFEADSHELPPRRKPPVEIG